MSTIDSDADRVANVAGILEVSEFDVFKLAYLAWHAKPARDEHVERLFGAYLMRQDIPVWVRHFVRKIEFQSLGDDMASQKGGTSSWPQILTGLCVFLTPGWLQRQRPMRSDVVVG